MDYFYAPPIQRDDECAALEENYMNCLMQKALKDNVVVNKCVLSSVLWFPLECPKWHNKFNDPVEFKLKFKKFIAETKSQAHQRYNRSERDQKLHNETNYIPYPEDINVFKDAIAFTDEFKQHDTLIHMPQDADEEFEPVPFLHNEVPKHLRGEIGSSTGYYPENPTIE